MPHPHKRKGMGSWPRAVVFDGAWFRQLCPKEGRWLLANPILQSHSRTRTGKYKNHRVIVKREQTDTEKRHVRTPRHYGLDWYRPWQRCLQLQRAKWTFNSCLHVALWGPHSLAFHVLRTWQYGLDSCHTREHPCIHISHLTWGNKGDYFLQPKDLTQSPLDQG